MQNKTLLVIAVLLGGMSCELTGVAQDSDETLPPLVSEEYTLEGEATAESDATLWTPAFLSGSTSVLADSLRQGHVYSSIDFAMLSASDEAFQFDGDSVLTPQFQLGWEGASGFGVRGSYWEFENGLFDESPDWGTVLTDGEINQPYAFIHIDSQSFIPVNSNSVVNFPIEHHAYPLPYTGRIIESLDLDAYQRFNAGNSQITVGAGLKSVQGRWQQISDSGVIFAENHLFAGIFNQQSVEGIGPSLFAEFRKPVFVRESMQMALFTVGRTSFVPAEYEFRSSSATPLNIDDELWINEANGGVELSRRYRRLMLRLRGQFETQLWNSSVMDNQALTGTSLSFGVDW